MRKECEFQKVIYLCGSNIFCCKCSYFQAMNLTNQEIEKEAQLLYLAERNRKQLSATTTRYPNMTIDDAYAIQKQGIELKKNDGRTVIGSKIGLTSRVMQRSMKIHEPDYGILMDDMVFEEGTEIVAANFLDPRVEVELAFMLHTPLKGEHITIFDVLRATEYVIPAVELIAARTFRVHPETKYVRTVCDTIADNAAYRFWKNGQFRNKIRLNFAPNDPNFR
jgi:2-oxo-hept-3-ene-1,7-dioate hydratase